MSFYDESFNELKKGAYTSVDTNGLRYDAFCCSYCFKVFFDDYKDLHKIAKSHSKRCSFRLDKDGFNIITKERLRNNKIKHAIDQLGSISKDAQGIDFPMTHSDSVNKLNQVLFIYIENGKPLGMLTTDKRKIILEDGTKKEFISVSDFIVFPYVQRKGIGKGIFDTMLSFYNKNPLELAYCCPSPATQDFLQKWYNINRKDLVCW